LRNMRHHYRWPRRVGTIFGIIVFAGLVLVALMLAGNVNAQTPEGGALYPDGNALNRANVMVTYAPPRYGQPAFRSVSAHKNGDWVNCAKVKCPKVGRLVFTKDHKALFAKPTRSEYIAGVIRNFTYSDNYEQIDTGWTSFAWNSVRRINFKQQHKFDKIVSMSLLSVTVFFEDNNQKLTHPQICNDVDCPDTMVGPGTD
jgi:hypothetical protein